MSAFFNCFRCSRVAPLLKPDEKMCPLCGSSNGEIVSSEKVTTGMKTGVFFNIDPKTGKRAKPKRS